MSRLCKETNLLYIQSREVGVWQGWGYLCVENINDKKDRIGQSPGGSQDTVSWPSWPRPPQQCHTDWYRIRVSPALVNIAALHYETNYTTWHFRLRIYPVSGGESPLLIIISGSRFSINSQECKWLLNFAPTITRHSGLSLTPASRKTVTLTLKCTSLSLQLSSRCLSLALAYHLNPLTFNGGKELRSGSRSLSLVPNPLSLKQGQ